MGRVGSLGKEVKVWRGGVVWEGWTGGVGGRYAWARGVLAPPPLSWRPRGEQVGKASRKGPK